MQPPDWEAIRSARFLFEDGCWHTCGGGFCCSNGHPDFRFQLIPLRGTTLLYMEDEYLHLAAHGAVPERAHHGMPPGRIELDFGGPRPLTLVQTPCRLLGLCDGVIDKPLLCRLYPFVPVLDAAGALEDLVPASIFDLTFALRGPPTPCTVAAKKAAYLARWRAHPEALDLLRHPYVMLHLQAARHFQAVYAEGLAANAKLAGLEGPSFWSAWELQYLGGRLVDGDELRSRVRASYDALVVRFGEFLAPADA